MTRTRRILQVVGYAAGGIGVHVADLSSGLRASGEQVLVVAPTDTAQRFELGSVDSKAWPQARRPRQAIAAMRRLRRLIRTSTVVHAHGHQAGMIALLAAIGTRTPVIVSWHNAILAQRGVGALAQRWQVRTAALVTGASQDLVDQARELGARIAELAPVAAPAAGSWMGSKEDARAQVTQILGLESAETADGADELWMLTVSRIAPQKDLGMLVEAAREVAATPTHHPVRWIVVGDGDDDLRHNLLESIGALPVHLVGARSDVPLWMAASDVLVVPSRWEARALVVQEALAAGLPVVATDVGGLPELVTGAGALVPVGDSLALAAAVEHLVGDDARRAELGEAARARFAELPTSDDVIAAWQERYQRITRSGLVG